VDREIDAEREKLERYLAVIERANSPRVLPAESSAMLEEIAAQHYEDLQGVRQPYLTATELSSLQIPRGSLTVQERAEIENHVVHSRNFLEKIPWGRALDNVVQIAACHHEKLDGSGYPAGLRGDTIPIGSKMMAIADIFDALTASDRPYKKAMDPKKAIAIISEDTAKGKYDSELCRLFVERRVYESVLGRMPSTEMQATE
jgi:hypothetical protein